MSRPGGLHVPLTRSRANIARVRSNSTFECMPLPAYRFLWVEYTSETFGGRMQQREFITPVGNAP